MVRNMPKPSDDPTKRGQRRDDEIDKDESILPKELELARQEPSDPEDAQEEFNFNIFLRSIPRDNPNDPFKPHSIQAIKQLAEGLAGHLGQPALLPEEEQMLQEYGYDLDQCTMFDRPMPSVKRPDIPQETQFELNRIPAWLRSFIESKYNQIHAKFGDDTARFFKQLALRLEYQKTKHTQLVGEPRLGEVEEPSIYIAPEQFDDKDEYIYLDDEDPPENKEVNRQNIAVAVELDPFRKNLDSKSKTEPENVFKPKDFQEVVRLARKQQDKHLELWSPILIQKAGDSLRAALVAGASETEDEDYWEEGGDEIIRQKELKKGTVRYKDKEFVYRGAHWESIVAEKSGFQEEARAIVDKEFLPEKLLHEKEREEEREKQKKAVRKKHEKALEKAKSKKAKGEEVRHPLLRQSKEAQREAAMYREHGVGKRPSRLFATTTTSVGVPISNVERHLHQTRSFEGMRAYANWIAASTVFKYFIIVIIFGNAALLAFETGESRISYSHAYDLLDSFFLSIYLAEFLLKFFAYPNQYFRSGFNIFDFVILIVSLVKAIADWTNYADLAFLTIIRALRILRAVSISIHIQVLVRALIDTTRRHVFSVVLLLVILMYIMSIVAYYLFGRVPGLDGMFGKFDVGMLRLFMFVTMEGWTYIMDRFKDHGQLHEGRLFCLTMIVLGNFIFANIFIAIIIMQISDATDDFRRTRANETDIKVSKKQEEVFRRQKLDMRQLLARQRLGVTDDFYELGTRFVRRLRHDDLADSKNVLFSPLWMDSLYKSMQRSHHTSNVIMNQHRKMSDRLARLGQCHEESKLNVKGISRARYNRYFDIKAKLRLIKEEFLLMRNAADPPPQPKVKFDLDTSKSQKVASQTKSILVRKDISKESRKTRIIKQKPDVKQRQPKRRESNKKAYLNF